MSAALVPVEQIQARTAPWTERAHALAVAGDRDYQRAAEWLQDIRALRSEIAAACDPVIRAAHAAHKAATAQKAELERELVEADRVIRAKLAGYHQEQQRIAAQAKAVAEAQAREVLAAAEREAATLAAAGESELAEMARAEAALAPAPVAPTAHTVAAAGVSTRDVWEAAVTDWHEFLAGVLEGSTPWEAVQANEKLLGQMARALKDGMKWRGVTVSKRSAVVVRGNPSAAAGA